MIHPTCELCERIDLPLTRHHLLPREEGGNDTHIAYICPDCHKQIHALYTNKELALRLSTLTDLKSDDKIERYLRFIKKQPSSRHVRIKKSNHRKQSF